MLCGFIKPSIKWFQESLPKLKLIGNLVQQSYLQLSSLSQVFQKSLPSEKKNCINIGITLTWPKVIVLHHIFPHNLTVSAFKKLWKWSRKLSLAWETAFPALVLLQAEAQCEFLPSEIPGSGGECVVKRGPGVSEKIPLAVLKSHLQVIALSSPINSGIISMDSLDNVCWSPDSWNE